MAAAERGIKLLDTKVEINEAPVTKIPDGPGRIEFDHVCFAYRTVAADKDSEKERERDSKSRVGGGRPPPSGSSGI